MGKDSAKKIFCQIGGGEFVGRGDALHRPVDDWNKQGDPEAHIIRFSGLNYLPPKEAGRLSIRRSPCIHPANVLKIVNEKDNGFYRYPGFQRS
jgi:hypothetical protein